MEGGGVKGTAFVGALDVLSAVGYTFPRIAGTSAGAITGSLVAALQHADESPNRLSELVATLDYSRVPDSSRIGRALGPAHVLADVVSLAARGGLHEGRYLQRWLTGVLADLGVRTFGDLRRTDPGSALHPEREFSLVVVTSDLSNHRMSLLPWDYEHYGLDPDEQSVAEAVCASAAIPFMFRPVRLRTPPRGAVSLVDGGLLSNYPIGVFDQPDRTAARWPTFGMRLSAREDEPSISQPVGGLFGVTKALVSTALHGIDRRHIDEPSTIDRTMFIDTAGTSALDFELAPAQSERLIRSGREAANKFLTTKAPELWPGS
ncbi:patatin-like phospholipase family protein [Brevibacterium yomogidense]